MMWLAHGDEPHTDSLLTTSLLWLLAVMVFTLVVYLLIRWHDNRKRR